MLQHPLLVAILLFVTPGKMLADSNESPYVVATVGDEAIQPGADNWMARTRFGMFIHFGLYSIPAGVWNGEEMGRNHYAEWIRTQWRWPRPDGGIPKEDYDSLLAKFDPVNFDADEWIRLASAAGMRYSSAGRPPRA